MEIVAWNETAPCCWQAREFQRETDKLVENGNAGERVLLPAGSSSSSSRQQPVRVDPESVEAVELAFPRTMHSAHWPPSKKLETAPLSAGNCTTALPFSALHILSDTRDQQQGGTKCRLLQDQRREGIRKLGAAAAAGCCSILPLLLLPAPQPNPTHAGFSPTQPMAAYPDFRLYLQGVSWIFDTQDQVYSLSYNQIYSLFSETLSDHNNQFIVIDFACCISCNEHGVELCNFGGRTEECRFAMRVSFF